MKRLRPLAALFVIALGACSGGAGTSISSALPQTAAAPAASAGSTQSSAAVQTLNEAQSDAATSPQPLYTPSVNDLLYVANTGTNSITIYKHDEQGNTAPRKVIAGSKTGINAPGQLSEDAAGNLYVVTNGAVPAILVFAHGASGNVAPIRKLAGPLTGLDGSNAKIGAMTVDQTTGKIFVAVASGNGGQTETLLRFPPNATGNTAPFAVGTTSEPAFELASASGGQNIIEAHGALCCNSTASGISTFQKQYPNGTALTPVDDITSQTQAGVADDASTKTYLVTTPLGILRLAENTVGYGPDNYGGVPGKYTPAVVSTISSDTCGGQLALGYLRNIYVVHTNDGACPTDAVYVYTHDASGSAVPLRILSGPVTQLNLPSGIYEGQ